MSRNIQRKYRPPPAKAATKRRGSVSSSSLDLSDDDGYSGLEDVSDSDEEDEEHVFAAEEEHIISNEAHKRSSVPPRSLDDENLDADEEEEDDGEDDDDDDEDDEDDDDEDEEEDEDELDEHEGATLESLSWEGIMSEHEELSTDPASYMFDHDVANVERHVRFTGVPDSDSDSTTSDASGEAQDFFPDIFVEQSSLDPAFRREIENDDDSSNSGSFWDFNSSSQDLHVPNSDVAQVDEYDDATPIATPMASQALTEASTPVASGEVQELDGYETDGDTTEEDTPEPVVRKKTKRPCTFEVSSDSDTERPIRFRHGKPRVGQFNLDRAGKKPIAVLNPVSRKMMIFTPQRMSRLDLSPESFNIDFSTQDLSACSPILSNPGYVMMGAMLSSNTFGDFMNTQPFGPAEAFFPLTSDAITGDDSDASESGAPQEDEEESMLKIEDFITFHHDSSDEEEDGGGPDWTGDGASSPSRPKTAASGTSVATDTSAADAHPLLSHFGNNSEAVGAFRRNQINQQLIFSDKASQDSLAFSGPYYHGTLRGIKTGSMETVTTPITPARRQKRKDSTAGGNSPGSSPSILSQKRKASQSFADAMHKRQRSISELGVMRI
ncbi:hypothetical protein B0T26DRAFT_744671 [Lasiosphaeria miniovina]|uniref:Uncharacterized protein n=1 Tax=Lasiosphaeria miniovina TaxID=1954250 RepID=A0AA40DHI9_9PEZI|nr:uncharacterized protein B0T26DRAFT_744671 [Lasiosphaeria miniovina]KAK0701601.1 hypothetical protein B0T26DRAFT_744671 [Lasiosphaeria miniovina]